MEIDRFESKGGKGKKGKYKGPKGKGKQQHSGKGKGEKQSPRAKMEKGSSQLDQTSRMFGKEIVANSSMTSRGSLEAQSTK